MMNFILKRNTPQLAATGIKGMRIQLRFGSAQRGSIFMRRGLACPDACIGVRRRCLTEYFNQTMAKPFKWTYQGKALTA
jgi:hypothetical protein